MGFVRDCCPERSNPVRVAQAIAKVVRGTGGVAMNRQSPTAQERIALKRIAAVPMRTLLAVVSVSGLVLSLQVLPERYSTVSAIAAVTLALSGIAVMVYQACFLRCPRCSAWIAIPKCPDCGLKLDKPASDRKSVKS